MSNSKSRKKMLAKIAKEERMNKAAQAASADVNNLNISNPEEYYSKLFDALVDNLRFEALDD